MRARLVLLVMVLMISLCGGGVCMARRAIEPVRPGNATQNRIAHLVHQLGDADFHVRERAQAELAKLGVEAFDALSEAETSSDVEIADRAQYLLRQLQVEWVRKDDPLDVQMLLGKYMQAGVDQRAGLIEQIGRLPDDRDVTPLCRIVRFERSTPLSKRAALQLIEKKLPAGKDAQSRAEAIVAGLGASPRVGAQWTRAFVASFDDAAAANDAWARLTAAEQQSRGDLRDRSDDDILFRLLRQQALVLRKLGRTDENLAIMRRMLEIGPDDDETFTELIDWLVEQKAWTVVDEAAHRYAARFDHDPLLLYTLAQAAEEQGRSDEARKIIDQARDLNEGNAGQHLLVAYRLQQRGKFEWSEHEYRKAIEVGGPGSGNTLTAQVYLSEMLHDQQRDREAGQALKDAIAAIEGEVNAGREIEMIAANLGGTRARMHFFLACAAAPDDRKEQIEHLQAGAKEDPYDADVLIAMYRVPGGDPAVHETAKRLIHEAVEEFRKRIRSSSDEPSYYNQLAWLVANTEGDQKEALQASLKSLELRPGTAGYLDTLARCYYALGDYPNAVKNQEHAIELEPYSGTMQRQLELFRKSLRDQ